MVELWGKILSRSKRSDYHLETSHPGFGSVPSWSKGGWKRIARHPEMLQSAEAVVATGRTGHPGHLGHPGQYTGLSRGKEGQKRSDCLPEMLQSAEAVMCRPHPGRPHPGHLGLLRDEGGWKRSARHPEMLQPAEAVVAAGRTGFTLVELLVVIAIIGMLVGLLLPAVQQAREAARTMQCSNQIKQMALACLNFESQQRSYPSGGWSYTYVGDPDRGLGMEQPGSWYYRLLPFLEQNALYQLGSDGQPDVITDTQKQGAYLCNTSPIPGINCPSRRTSKVYPIHSWTANNCTALTSVVKTDYAGSYGSNRDKKANTPSTYLDAGKFPTSSKYDWPTIACGGIFYDRSHTTIAEVTDGTTNTYLIGEKYVSPDYYESDSGAETSFSEDNGLYCGMERDNLRTAGQYNGSTGKQDAYLPMQDRPGYEAQTYRFGSAHAGAWGVAFCDGSVSRVSYSIDAAVHLYLGTRNDRKVFTRPD